MSTTCLHIVPKHSNEYSDSKLKANEILRWFHERDIVEKKLSDCILSKDKLGYRFKPNISSIFINGDRWAFNESLTVHGLEIISGNRNIFFSMDGPGLKITCPSCKKTISEELAYDWVNEWYEDEHIDFFICPFCSEKRKLLNFEIDQGVVLSNIGISLWNTHWELKPEFLEEMRKIFKNDITVIFEKT